MKKSIILAACFGVAATFASAESVPLNTNVQGGSGSEVEVGQAGAALVGSLGTGGIVAAAAAIVLIVAVASDDDNATTTTQ